MKLTMPRRSAAFCAVFLAAVATVAIPGLVLAAEGQDDVVARIGNSDVRADEVRAYVAALDPREQAVLARDPALLSQAVRNMLAGKLVLKEALAQKWDQQPSVVARIQRARESTIVETYLQSVSQVPENFPSDAEIQAAYDANKTAFLVPRQFDLAQIFVAVPKDADKATQDKARHKLDEIEKKLRQRNADFGAIAQSESDDPTAEKKKGDLGWLIETQIVPEIRTQVLGMAKGAVAEPMQLADGWHVVKLIDTKPAYTRPLSEVREQIVTQLRNERAMAERRAYLGKLLQQTPPTVNEFALSKILAKSEK
jgi:parvulin-like peptidyl-prolyl isomerase